MRFEIQWTGHQGSAMTHRATPAEAVRFAIEMLGKGFSDVVVWTWMTAARPTPRPNLRSSIRLREGSSVWFAVKESVHAAGEGDLLAAKA